MRKKPNVNMHIINNGHSAKTVFVSSPEMISNTTGSA